MHWVHLIKANFRKEYIELIRYLPNTIAMLVTFYAIFLGMFFGIQVVGDPSMQDTNIQYVIVNYVFWFLAMADRKSTRLNSSHVAISYAVFCLNKKRIEM